MALKIKATDYYQKNLELVDKDFYIKNLEKRTQSKSWSHDNARYIIMQEIKIHLKCKTNFPGEILNEIDKAGFEIKEYGNQDIFCYRKFQEVIITTWDELKRFANEVQTHNTYLVHNEMRGIRRKYMKFIYWYEIYENSIRIILDDIVKRSSQRELR
jgi:hypothetical protein